MDFTCNKCNEEIDINDYELFELYSEDDWLEIMCPCCGEEIIVKIEKTYSFKCVNEDEL